MAFLQDTNFIKKNSTKNAMFAVDRKFFAPSNPYQDAPQVIGFNATISAPHMRNSKYIHVYTGA